jgi:glutamate formiminotransferase
MIVECVPNFSEGRDPVIVHKIAAAISSVPGAKVLDRTSDPDHHRTVITFAGDEQAVEQAALEAASSAIRHIDLTTHAGVHPRIGAIDVIPFVPVSGVSLAECAALARRVASQLWTRFQLPSFLYEAASDSAKALETVRREARAGIPPDVGEGRHPTAGAAAVGARNFLIAWNIHLATSDLALAKRIARTIRFSSGGFPGVKALGLSLESRGEVQVSINSTDFDATPLHVVFQKVAAEAHSAGVAISGSELIGLIPARAVDHNLQWIRFEPGMILENALQSNQCW